MIRAILLLALLASPQNVAARACPPLDVRAMSYNIRLDIESDGLNAWPRRRKEFIGQIELIRPNLIGLQEVVPGQRRDLIKALTDYEFLGAARDDGKDAGEYSLIGVRRSEFRTLSSGTFWLSETPDRPSLGWDAAYKRVVTWARLKHRRTGSAILLLNTHWDHQGSTAREHSATLIKSWLSRNARTGEQLVITGDFNAPLSEPSMQHLAAGGLRDSRVDAGVQSFGPSASFNAFQMVVPPGVAIDHILVGPRWRTLRHWIVSQHIDGRPLSDHYPVVADLRAVPAICRR